MDRSKADPYASRRGGLTLPVARRVAVLLTLLVSAGFTALAAADPAPPAASFSYSPTTPLTLETVTFTSSSSDADGPLALEQWDLNGDGQYDDATGSEVQHSFSAAGTYTVGLKVTDGDNETAETSQSVTVANRAPAASFDFTPAVPSTLQTVTFNSTSTDADGTVSGQDWDLDNDGQFDDASGPSAQRLFLLGGNYPVALRVTDNNGDIDEVTQVVSIGNRSPSASFTSLPAAPKTGDDVTFSSGSTDADGSIASELWDLDNDGQFDDGSGDTAQRSFGDNGVYTVKLQVADNDGATDVASRTVTVSNRKPAASFTVSPASPQTGQQVTFTGTSTDPDGTIAARAWDLDNDGQFDDGTGSSAQRSFPTAGTYTVKLLVTDDDGATDEQAVEVTVGNRLPTAAFGFSPATPQTGDDVTFASSSSDPDGPIASQEWDLDGDGQFDDGAGVTAQKTFTDSGPQTVRLRVTDADGGTDVVEHVVSVTNRGPVAFFDFSPGSPQTGALVTFTSGSSDPDGSIASLAWDLDNDGQFDDAVGATAQRSFPQNGTYTVKLKVTDDTGAVATATDTVVVANRAPSAGFTTAPSSPLTGEQVTFTSGSTDPDGSIASQAWDLDADGQFDDGTGTTATRAFSNNGIYTIKLRVTDDDGATDTTSHTVTVANRPPTAAFTFSPATPQTGQAVTFTSTSTDPDGAIASYAWDLNGDDQFNDGTANTASRSFATDGTYTVKLRVTDSDGSSDIVAHPVTVANRPPTAAFTFSPATPQTGQAVTFTSTSTDPDGSIAAQAWDLDNDGQYDDSSSPTTQHTFGSAGNYTVRLLVTDDKGLTRTVNRIVPIANRGPAASFGHSPASPLTGGAVTFTATATDPDGFVAGYAWDLDNDGQFNDGSNATAQRSFAASGTYTVKLRVTDNDGATDISTGTVSIGNRAPVAALSFSPNPPVTGQAVIFTSTATDPDGAIAAQAWDLDNDGQFDDGIGVTAQRSFPTAASYPVHLRVTDNNGATDEVSVIVTPGNQPPTAAFEFSPTSPQTGQAVTFTGTSTDPDGSIAARAWDLDNDGQFDDGAASVVTGSFATPGLHAVKLRVTDNDGAVAVATNVITVSNRGPAAAFNFSPAVPKTGEDVNFTSTSTDPDGFVAAFAWDLDNDGQFDDGSGPTAQFVFPDNGSFTVKLRVTDNNGATAVASQAIGIANKAPVASFTFLPVVPDTGQAITFTSTSTDPDGTIAGYAWDLDNDGQFDDGSGATVTKAFPDKGSHTVKLRVTDNDGAADVATANVGVANRPPVADFGASPALPPTGQLITFSATASDPDGTIAGYAWDLDNDGLFDDAASATAQRSFPNNGFYPVKVRVTDNDGAVVVATRIVMVTNRAPVAAFNQSPATPLTKEAVTFTSAATDPDGSVGSYAWDLDNDGQYDDGTAVSAQRSFDNSGTYTVHLRVTDDDGAQDAISKTVTVTNRPPAASISLTPLAPKPFEDVTFTSSATDSDGTVAAYAWDIDGDGFDDGTTPTIVKPRAFRSVGAQSVRLRVTDDDGDSTTATLEVFVGNRPPVASFVHLPNHPTPGQQVTFFSTASDPDSTIALQQWDLDGDGQFNDAVGTGASRSFPAPGAYTVSLRVVDADDAESIYSDTIQVVAPAPAAAPPQAPTLRLLSPFPVIRVAGRVYPGGTRLRLLSVNAPAGAVVTVRCGGNGCPFTSSKQSAVSAGSSRPSATIRIKKLERRLLRNGVTVGIFVTREGAVGKYTQIRIRRKKPPARTDRCLMPGSMKPTQCPS